ncbi:MAG: hypothetical protein LBQ77_05335, partial [Treponema sp.]|nr:hypothetical protein [Treponema sp.]
AGLVKANESAKVKQSNQALNLWTKAFVDSSGLPTFEIQTASVYRERTYTAAELTDDLFSIMLWKGAPSKVITFEVTQPSDATTKIIYKIDYSAVTFTAAS